MNLEITVTHTVTPELLAVLKALSTPHGAAAEVVTQATESPVVKIDKAVKPTKVKEEKASAEPVTEPAAAESSEKPLTLADVRAIAVPLSKAGRKDTIKSKYLSFQPGIDSINELDPKHFAPMLEWLKTL